MIPIDIVIPWVDGTDNNWLRSRKRYDIENQYLNTEARYRDFGILKYALRSIDKYLPWINKIFILTDHQVPSFIDIHHPKIRIVDHSEFIPEEFLPTFNSNVIELNVYRIDDLSERFILMNDDMLFTQSLSEEDFFKEDKVVDAAVLSPIFPREIGIGRILANNISIINTYFSKRDFVKNNFLKVYSLKYGNRLLKNIVMAPYKLFSGFYDYHIPLPYFKSIYKEVMTVVSAYYYRTCKNKFRSELDINHWLVRYWQLASGRFVPRKNNSSRYLLMNDIDKIQKSINKKSIKMICINDTNETVEYEETAKQILNILDNKFPNPASFEK